MCCVCFLCRTAITGPSTSRRRGQVMKEVLNIARNIFFPPLCISSRRKASKLGSNAGRFLLSVASARRPSGTFWSFDLSTRHIVPRPKTEGHAIKHLTAFEESGQPWQEVALCPRLASYFTCGTQQGSLSKRRYRPDVDPLLATAECLWKERRGMVFII